MAKTRHCDKNNKNGVIVKDEIDVWICVLCGAFSTILMTNCPDANCLGIMKKESRNYARCDCPECMASAETPVILESDFDLKTYF